MAFGINRTELIQWKNAVMNGQIAFLTHFWTDERFPGSFTVTKVGCNDLDKLIAWGKKYGLKTNWIHNHKEFPHFDLFGEQQKSILQREEQWEQINRFRL